MKEHVYVVIDEHNNTSYNAESEACERFGSFRQAELRAIELAEDNPGKPFHVCKTVAIVTAPVGKTQTIKLADK